MYENFLHIFPKFKIKKNNNLEIKCQVSTIIIRNVIIYKRHVEVHKDNYRSIHKDNYRSIIFDKGSFLFVYIFACL